jgi:hypothetical protein
MSPAKQTKRPRPARSGKRPPDAAKPVAEFDRFKDLSQKLIKVPKPEIDEKRRDA